MHRKLCTCDVYDVDIEWNYCKWASLSLSSFFLIQLILFLRQKENIPINTYLMKVAHARLKTDFWINLTTFNLKFIACRSVKIFRLIYVAIVPVNILLNCWAFNDCVCLYISIVLFSDMELFFARQSQESKTKAKMKTNERLKQLSYWMFSSEYWKLYRMKKILTGKKLGPIGPPGIPSFGGNCPIGLGAGPAFCCWEQIQIARVRKNICLCLVVIIKLQAIQLQLNIKINRALTWPMPFTP